MRAVVAVPEGGDGLSGRVRGQRRPPPGMGSYVVGPLAMFSDVEAFTLDLFLDAQTHGQVDELEEDEGADA